MLLGFTVVVCVYVCNTTYNFVSSIYLDLLSNVVSQEKDFDDNSAVFHPEFTHQVFGEK